MDEHDEHLRQLIKEIRIRTAVATAQIDQMAALAKENLLDLIKEDGGVENLAAMIREIGDCPPSSRLQTILFWAGVGRIVEWMDEFGDEFENEKTRST